jgi:hypothetical protein
MSEEATAVSTADSAAPAAPSSSGESKGNQESFGSISHRSNSVNLADSSPKEPKAPAAPDKPEADKGQGEADKATPKAAKAADKAKAPEAPAPVGVDERHAEMLKAQGIDPATIAKDPVALNKFLDNYANMHREFTKSKQAEATEKALKDAQASLPVPANKAPEKPLSPMEEYDQSFEYSCQPYFSAQGVQNMQQLWEKNPQLASYLTGEYNKGAIKALREDIAWQSTQANQKLEEQRRQIQYQNDLKDAQTFTATNLAEAKKVHPELDKMFKASGVDDFLKHLEDQYTIPRTFILSDKKWVDFFVKASAAQEAVSKMEDHDKGVIENYKKNLAKQDEARLPGGEGGSEVPNPKDDEPKEKPWSNSQARGVRL